MDADLNPILTRSEVYSGVYGRASITFYAFNSSGNRGTACGLNNLQKIRDDEPLGGKASAEFDFATDDDEDKTDGVTIRDSIGREQNPIAINESGLYSLILGSKLPTARRFKRWVTSEVLPSIRRHGLYAIDNILADPDIAIAALQELKAEREKRQRLGCYSTRVVLLSVPRTAD